MTRSAILFPFILSASLCAGAAFADTVDTLLTKAQAAEAHGDTELALRLAQSAIVADPARPGSYVALGDIYAREHEPDSARSYYDEALSIDPSDPSALKAMADLDRGAKTGTAVASP